ncbi:MAG: HlyD family type I secretion periplasmic adaptor subunit [Candidatus Thiodiazotropha sp. (ex Epidulcina cf. delphinae)]|nr:HlyD family type I secretion periplasmic adaptor subunit [Candidatus Thiodiazotropha sp. (ex Epidulcina cf. delphinae)]
MSAVAVFKDAWQNRHKLGDNKQSQELAAFLPAALEIQETPPNPLTRWLAWSLLALVLIAIIWACFGQVNIVASAEGKIIPSSRVKQIQPLEKGVVKAILVNEGDYVTQGQALIELDTTLTAADKNRLQSELHTTTLNLAVNQALLAQIETAAKKNAEKQPALRRDQLVLNLPASASAQETQLYQHLLWQQWQQYWSQYQFLQSSLRKTQAEQATSKEIISKLKQTLPIVTKRATTLENLHKKDFVSETDYLQAEQERIQNQQDLAAEKQRYQQHKAAESEVSEQINTHIAQTSGTLLAQIADQQRQIAALNEEFTKATDLNDKQILYAPVAGRVQELAINTVGGVVTEAQQLMLVIPDEEQLEVEVFLENKDIGFVHEEMPAEVKIHTFPFTKYGVIDAQVSNVSNDAIVDEQRGLIYSMQLRMAKNTIAVNGKDVNLMPGMAVTAEVKTGKRRIIEFFLAPLLRAKSESIRER